MDRIDIHLDVRRVPFEKLASLEGGEPSELIRGRVEAARKVQETRFAASGKANMLVNGDMGGPLVGLAEVQQFCQIDADGKELMRTAVRQQELSARSYHRVLKLARTIADLAGEAKIRTEHLAEAPQYRPRGGV
jgi:magnesium chelatase family protein